jgi:hypothetical protein
MKVSLSVIATSAGNNRRSKVWPAVDQRHLTKCFPHPDERRF